MIVLIYNVLLFSMLFILYRCGKEIARTGKVLSPAGIMAILVYTLNEGLRFGRGIDYNLYGMDYEDLDGRHDPGWDISFAYIARMLKDMDIPWQGYVLLMSCIFIVATILLIKVYKEVLPYALPLFVLFSLSETENMVRWYMGFSFIMIGVAYLICEEKRGKKKFLLFSLLACTFHVALAPFPIAFYVLFLCKKPLLKPVPVLVIFFLIAFFFQTSFMMRFVVMANMLSMVSERFEGYGDRAEYWLTGGFAGTKEHSALPNMHELLFLCSIIVLGYYAVKNTGKKYVYAYNLFIVGFLTYPIAKQIELVGRFNQPFMFFRAIVLACILEYIYIRRNVFVNRIILLFAILVFLNMGRKILINPFYGKPEKYLYVWDSKGKTYRSMYHMWIDDMYHVDTVKKMDSDDD